MESKLLGSVVVSHYVFSEVGQAKSFADERIKADDVVEVCFGESAAGSEVCTVFSRNGNDPYMPSVFLAVALRSSSVSDPEVE